jgi:polysaccharide biosynthesis protein PslG
VQSGGPTSFNWTRYDVLVDGARARGLAVLANLAYSPSWARPSGTNDKFAPDTSERRDAYARFAAAAVARYRDRVSAWEIWNEPNNTMFWQPAPNTASYAALLRHAYPAVKAADPAATVIAGATSPASTASGMIDEVQFIQGVYAAGGRGFFDAWSHHPYDFNLAPGSAHKDSAWWQMYGSTPSIRSTMEANGDGAKKLWGTEHGLPSSGYGTLNESIQAAWLDQAHQLWRGFTWAGPLFNYMVRDSASPGNAGYWYYMGLARDDWSRKPAFSVIQRAAATP